MPSVAPQKFTFADYVTLEETSTVRHEFLNGWVWAMAGGSPTHARVAANVTALLNGALSGERCAVFSSDLRVRSLETGLATYADVTVVYGKLEVDDADAKGHTAVNPTVVVEVLSPSTEDYDRGEKLGHYRTIPSLQYVVLIATDTPQVDLWERGAGAWRRRVYQGHDVLEMPAIDCALPLEAVYRDPLADGT